MTSHPPASDLVRKKSPSKWGKLRRVLASVFDPRAWAHMIKLLNYYNYAHVQPLRQISVGAAPAISPNVAFANPERITLGARVRLGVRCVLWAGPARGRIVLGDDVMCGPEVMMTASSYRYDDGQPVTEQLMDEADVIVGHDVWIGTRAVLLPGTTIGDGAIVAAHAVVRGTVPPMAVVAGAPARVVSHRALPGSTPDPS